jgi:Ca2+-binding EF-hand superfamily protein
MVIDPTVFKDLGSFMKSFTLKKVLLLRIAAQIPESEVETLKTIFKKMDTNGNGLISKEEMVAGMKEFSK